MRILAWLIRAALFFTLFAFALNNQHEASIRWFFSHEWRAPMVIVVLTAFAGGCVFGVLAMVPSWWKHRRVARRHAPSDTVIALEAAPQAAAALPDDIGPEHPPRDGL